ncbi:unnamed protein product [Acanthoscelides obtectus]|uniref:Uncharacterized protein n=1 Tax=Acanthoscelides obtectus TaxID=200917 RepID=A0A9P0LGX1_ACAOB|nr:unnamed protein product [Acanthoscelides obtectus]CAK1670136.1 hypothetical protein AOBTE_LOCUS27425 [Acanthoscelides obtectus]
MCQHGGLVVSYCNRDNPFSRLQYLPCCPADITGPTLLFQVSIPIKN